VSPVGGIGGRSLRLSLGMVATVISQDHNEGAIYESRVVDGKTIRPVPESLERRMCVVVRLQVSDYREYDCFICAGAMAPGK